MLFLVLFSNMRATDAENRNKPIYAEQQRLHTPALQPRTEPAAHLDGVVPEATDNLVVVVLQTVDTFTIF